MRENLQTVLKLIVRTLTSSSNILEGLTRTKARIMVAS